MVSHLAVDPTPVALPGARRLVAVDDEGRVPRRDQSRVATVEPAVDAQRRAVAGDDLGAGAIAAPGPHGLGEANPQRDGHPRATARGENRASHQLVQDRTDDAPVDHARIGLVGAIQAHDRTDLTAAPRHDEPQSPAVDPGASEAIEGSRRAHATSDRSSAFRSCTERMVSMPAIFLMIASTRASATLVADGSWRSTRRSPRVELEWG